MAEKRIPVRLILKGGSFANGNFILSDSHETFHLSLEFADQVITKNDRSLFHSLQEIRRELDKKGILLNCYGASKNVRPSGMSISMGGGVKAYRHTLGEKPKFPADIVDILETGADVQPVTVVEQEQFYEDWLKSNGLTPRK